MVTKEIENLKKDFNNKLKKLQAKCKHNWVEDGYSVQGWYSVTCYKCTICDKTKEEL